MEEKREIRERVRAARQAIDPIGRFVESYNVTERVIALPGVQEARTVLGYIATAEEIDPAGLLAVLRDRGARIALPRVDAPARLALHWVEEDTELEQGSFGIKEPKQTEPSASPEEIDLVLVPGVAFDESCNRLGYGGCFYDNLLPLLRPDALTVGLAFEVQLIDAVPTEPHDLRPRYVVTQSATHSRD